MGIIQTIRDSKKIMNHAVKESDLIMQLGDKELREYQMFLLQMYKDIKAVCDKYHLKLFVIGGTALGAVRHHGFIPWDDDLDTGMLREDYEVFKQVFEKELSDCYILNVPNYARHPVRGHARIMRKGTYYKDITDNDDEDLNHIYIDLFVLENIPENTVVKALKGKGFDLLYRVSKAVYFRENRTQELKSFYSSAGKANYYLRVTVGTIFSFRNSASWLSLTEKAAQWKKNSPYCGIPTGRKRYFGEIMRKEDVLPGVEFPFENEIVLVFSNYDPYLRNLYGDYMKLPPEEDRERHSICGLKYTLCGD